MLLWIPLLLQGQINPRGVPFIYNYAPEETSGSQQNWCIVRDLQGFLYVGNQEDGVMIFDGEDWSDVAVSNQSRIYHMAVSKEGIVYVGAVNEFGYLSPDLTGRMQYISLAGGLDSLSKGTQYVYDVLFMGEEVWFCTKPYLYRYLPEKDTVLTISHAKSNSLYGFHTFQVGDQAFRGDHLMGLMVQEGDTSFLAPGGGFYSRKALMFGIPFGEDEILFGTYQSGIFVYNRISGQSRPFTNARFQQVFTDLHPVYHGAQVGSDLFAIGTLEAGGCYIFNSRGELIYHLNKREGLRDDLITYVYSDREGDDYGHMWLALTDGLARVDLNLPFGVFDESYGFNSYILSINEFEGNLYLGTGSGVYAKTTDAEDRVFFEKIKEIGIQGNQLLYFKPQGEAPKFLAATIEGIYEIKSGGTVTLIDELIDNLDYEGKRYYVNQIAVSSVYPNRLYLGTSGGVIVLQYLGNDRYRELKSYSHVLLTEVVTLAEDTEGQLWVASNLEGVFRMRFEDEKVQIDTFGLEQGLPALNRNFVYLTEDKVTLATVNGMHVLDADQQSFVPDKRFGNELSGGKVSTLRLSGDREGSYWIGARDQTRGDRDYLLSSLSDGKLISAPFLKLPSKSTDVYFEDSKGTVWMGKSNVLYSVNKESLLAFTPARYPAITNRVVVGMDSVIFEGRYYKILPDGRRVVDLYQSEDLMPSIRYRLNNITFSFSSVFYEEVDQMEYAYYLEGFDRGWSSWQDISYKEYTNIPFGKYTFKVKSRNVYQQESEVAEYSFTILKPWYHTLLAYVGYLILGVLLLIGIIKVYTRRLKNENIRLEGIVAERTAEVVKQKEELESSIHYASRIQRALLPSEKSFQTVFSENFILFRPRDIVSGDFYWMSQVGSKVFVCAADCTGHGVPGAFMSLLGISFLNEIVNSKGVYDPDKILNDLRDHVINSLKQTGTDVNETKDGMDLGMSVFDFDQRKVFFAGAYNPLFRIRPLTKEERQNVDAIKVSRGDLLNEEYYLEQIAADRMPIGISGKQLDPFRAKEVPMIPGERFYMFSDGYVDQFGGEKGKKLLVKNFKRLLLRFQTENLDNQHSKLNDYLDEWMGTQYGQIDDILVVGLEIP